MKKIIPTQTGSHFSRFTNYILPLVLMFREAILLRDHQLWRDELQAWLISYQSKNPSDLISNLKYEGRPPLWHLLLWILTKFSDNPDMIKILTFEIFAITVIILFSFKFIPLIGKISLSLGFYFSYGYSVVSRDYNLLLLLCLLLLVTHEKFNKKGIEYIICLLLAFTNPFGSVLALAWIVISEVSSMKKNSLINRRTVHMIVKILPILIIIFIFRMPQDSIFKPNLNISLKKFLTGAATTLVKPFVPFSDNHSINSMDIALSIIVLICLLTIFQQLNLNIKIGILIPFSLVFANAIIGYSLYWWHFGVSFLLLFIALAIQQMSGRKLHGVGFQIPVWILLFLQIAGSIWGYGEDFSKGTVYSNIKYAASYIQGNFPNSTIVSNSEVFASPLYAYLHPNKIYIAGINKYVYFTSWKNTENVTPSEGELVDRAISLNNSIIVTSYFPEITDIRVHKVKSFKGAVWGDNFEIYEINGTK